MSIELMKRKVLISRAMEKVAETKNIGMIDRLM